jgi:integrase/recombinase XerD
MVSGRPHARSFATLPPERACAGGFAPHQLRHAHAVEMAREGVPLIVIQRQLGHTRTRGSPQGIDNTEIIDTVHARGAPMVPVDATLRL